MSLLTLGVNAPCTRTLPTHPPRRCRRTCCPCRPPACFRRLAGTSIFLRGFSGPVGWMHGSTLKPP